jgi:hypothetical protein
MQTTRPSSFLVTLLLAFAGGCAGTVDGAAATDDPNGGEVAANLDLTGYKNAGQVVCDIMNSLPGGNIAGVGIDKPTCSFTNYDNLYYLGSLSQPISFGGPPPAVSHRAPAMSDALFCALKDSAGAVADGTFGTPVGRFGIKSRIDVPKFDAGARQVVGQRLGTLFLFGKGIDIEDQDYVVSFPTERATGGALLIPHTGYYMDLQSAATTWRLGGSGTVGLFTLSLSFGQNGYFSSMNNDAFALSPRDGNNHADDLLSWTHWQSSCNSCIAAGSAFCDCPGSGDIAQHNQFAGWSDAQFRNLGDGTLPYWGPAGGVSGNYVYRDASKNWTMFGRSSGSGISAGQADAEPSFDVLHNPSTDFHFTFALDYEIIALSLALGVDFKSGMDLTQSSHFENEFKNHYADVATTLDAQSGATLDARLVIRNPFPFGPDYLVDETFHVLNPTTHNANGHVTAASISYDFTDGFPYHAYSGAAVGTAPNAQAAHDACVAVAPRNNPPTTPGSPEALAQQAAAAAADAMWPCHVRICKPTGSTFSGTLQTCEWNHATKKLDCVQTTQPCGVCQAAKADLCLADGSVMPAPNQGTTRGVCAIK